MASPAELIPHMHRVQAAERDMRELGLVWQMIESAAAISCPEEVAPILPTLSRTRERFGELQVRLIERLASESRDDLGDELSAKARCAIDILMRNLFERTADVGFLATDETIQAFCGADPASRRALLPELRSRLAAYQSKYTVYDDIVVLDTDGGVLARLDSSQALERSLDPIIGAALGTQGYVEQFSPSDLAGSPQAALLYAHRIETTPGRPIGVLVLRFRFADEMQRIFSGMADQRAQIAMVLIDDRQRVIATNDEAHVPTGSTLARLAPDEVVLTTFGGREYIAVVCPGRPFQGYQGPQWRAQAMVSLLTAFRPDPMAPDEQEIPLDNPELARIQRDADEINRELRRVVWNGELMAQTHPGDRVRLKAVLSQVSHSGQRTRQRVGLAVRELYRTSLTRTRRQAHDLARLAADIMDRSLYERANDCRWWALSPTVGALLAGDDTSTAAMNALLDRLNDLYTVYSRIVVFDAQGRVRGLSRQSGRPELLGRHVDARWREAVHALRDHQQYAVTAFEPNDFHDGGPTYTYLAAIRSPVSSGHAVAGGIAIVFDAAAQLSAMLRDIIGQRHGVAAFIDNTGKVLSSSDSELAHGAVIGFAGSAALVEHGGHHYACARVRAAGYREFKTTDGYANGVSAIVALRLGPTERRRRTLSDETIAQGLLRPTVRRRELGVFQVGAGRYALPVNALIHAVAQRGLVRAPSALHHSIGMLEVDDGGRTSMVQVICARRLLQITYPARAGDGVVLVLRSSDPSGRAALGLRVDDVLSVVEVEEPDIQPAPMGGPGTGVRLNGIVDCSLRDGRLTGQGRALVQVLDPQHLIGAALATSGETASALRRTETESA